MNSADWDERYRSTPLVWSDGPNRFLPERISDVTPGDALDLATGEGRNALWLASLGWNVTAVDYSSVAIDKARLISGERGLRVDWMVADLLSWQPQRTYDLVIEFYLHLPAGHLRDIHRKAVNAVGPGGRLIIVGHDVANLDRGQGGPQDPAVLFTVDGLTTDVEGLDVLEAAQLERQLEGGIAIDTVLVAERA
ncbi:MAG: class I SAM-dependent methyltransferase [Acidimicrobiia bacterium]|nr:class I SAM-dependent methyltransferase [Acidimicrobiia bacterium]